ncbi:MAG: Fe-S oxidoreductase [Alphaproteobacteria bacterium]|nr:Fe-S oxidoreductase [Alphaproteobacteria bacterium]
MQTNFTPAQLEHPDIARADAILRKCVHCGFCTATCPTYVLLGDERDSPRGRIYFIKDMLEKDKPATKEIVTHIDRCLSCLSCMTTCPSGVNYMHLIDQGRAHVERTYRRPLSERLPRALLGFLMPRPWALRWSLILGRLVKPFAALLPRRDAGLLASARAMLESVPQPIPAPSPVDKPQIFPAQGPRRKRVALLSGCGQTVLAPEVNEATIRLLTRHGVEVVVASGMGCCGSSVLHIGRDDQARDLARANVVAWEKAIAEGGLDAVIANASGCGTTLKDYGHLLADDPAFAQRGARIAALARDISEVMLEIGLNTPVIGTGQRVAYHSACSMQHGQQVVEQPKMLLRAAGFDVKDVPEGHLCCGWAGTYSVLQPGISQRLRQRKAANIESVRPDIVAAGNFGCIGQIAAGTQLPLCHTVELLDWATGGPQPVALTR